MTISIIDYGHGNIFSVCSAVSYLGYSFALDKDGSGIRNAKIIVIPGVAEFRTGIESLKKRSQFENILKAHELEIPIIGLCLGAQMLLDSSEEAEGITGLKLVRGQVDSLKDENDRLITFQGWSYVNFLSEKWNKHFQGSQTFYFSHSFHMKPAHSGSIVAKSESINQEINCIIQHKNVLGIQFHPERSGKSGLTFLNWVLKTENWL